MYDQSKRSRETQVLSIDLLKNRNFITLRGKLYVNYANANRKCFPWQIFNSFYSINGDYLFYFNRIVKNTY